MTRQSSPEKCLLGEKSRRRRYQKNVGMRTICFGMVTAVRYPLIREHLSGGAAYLAGPNPGPESAILYINGEDRGNRFLIRSYR
jgi:hypothetical protein